MNGIMLGFQEKFTSAILKISPHVTLLDTELRPQAPLLERYYGKLIAADVAHESPSQRQSQIKRPYEIVRALRTLPERRRRGAAARGDGAHRVRREDQVGRLRGIEVAAQDKVTPFIST